MRIHLDNEWLLDGDELSVNLVRLRTVSGDNARGRAPNPENIGKVREEVVGFYGSMAQACQAYMNKRVQGSDATTAEQIISLVEQAVTAILDATKDIPRAVVAR
jgi:hypothetical protein